MPKPQIQTLVIDNFEGSMTSIQNGNINSGLTNVVVSAGYDSFAKPHQLRWVEKAVQIDAAASVITDLIMCGKTRLESGIVYVYAVGHTGRIYKIQVNDPTTYNPNYDNPVLLTTITINSPTFTNGGFIDFFGATERIYIGHDKGVTQLDFAGTNEAFVGSVGTWTQSVPRPLQQFLGKLYAGNGSNIAEIDSTLTVTSYTKLSPGLQSNYQARDIDTTPDGAYIQIVATTLSLSDMTSTTPNTTLLQSGNSAIAKWNGTDIGITSTNFYPNTVLSSNSIFGNKQNVFGYDYLGGAMYDPIDKMIGSFIDSSYSEPVSPNAVIAFGGFITWIQSYYFGGFLNFVYSMVGTIESVDVKPGWWSPLSAAGTGTETDVIRVPCQILVSNFVQGASSNGYVQNQAGSAKIYYSTLESSVTPTTKYKLYKWSPAPTGLGTLDTSGFSVYQTQTQLFSKKMAIKAVRIYGEPWVANNAFTIDLVGSAMTPISGASKTFTAGTNLTIGDDMAMYNPAGKPTYALALRITNAGTKNVRINKVEIDVTPAGQ